MHSVMPSKLTMKRSAFSFLSDNMTDQFQHRCLPFFYCSGCEANALATASFTETGGSLR
jgi:hypothetical protein